MKENKGISLSGFVITILLILLVLAVLGCIYLYKNPVKEQETEQNLMLETKTPEIKTNENTYSKIKGEYKCSIPWEREDEIVYKNFVLTLYENGSFSYEMGADAPYGFIGNYTVEGNKIVLNRIFLTGSDVSLTLSKGQFNLLINNEGIIDNNKFDEVESVQLKKETNQTNEEYIYNKISAAIKEKAIFLE